MKPLKLKKVKISRIGNPHLLFGGLALPAQGAQQPIDYPITYTLDTKLDETCTPGTNGGSIGRTIGAPMEPIHSGVQN